MIEGPPKILNREVRTSSLGKERMGLLGCALDHRGGGGGAGYQYIGCGCRLRAMSTKPVVAIITAAIIAMIAT